MIEETSGSSETELSLPQIAAQLEQFDRNSMQNFGLLQKNLTALMNEVKVTEGGVQERLTATLKELRVSKEELKQSDT